MTKILIVDDESKIRELLSRIISLEGYEVIQAESIKAATKLLLSGKPQVVLCDVRLPDGNGLDFIATVRETLPDSEVIMLTAHGNIADGVQAIKNGAYDYLTKGDDNNRIIPLLANAAEKVEMRLRLQQLESVVNKRYSFDSIIGKSHAITEAIEMTRKVSKTDTSILLTGETGTGKEVFANAIHFASSRATRPLIAVNCSAMTHELLESEMFGYKMGAFTGANRDKKGLFEQANKGTIFLDEIGEMPLDLQAKLLRVLESGEFIKVGDGVVTRVDVRVIAATNRNLKECVAHGLFREDLYYRLSVFNVELPPLRSRVEDIVPLTRIFIAAFSAKLNKQVTEIEEPVFDSLKKYSWHGNIRELRNVIERAMILSSDGKLRLCDLPYEVQMPEGVVYNEMELANIERQHICKVIRYTHGNKTEAARLLKIGLTTLYRKLEDYKIE